MIIKLPILIGLMYLYVQTGRTMLCAVLLAIMALLFGSLFSGSFSLMILLNAGITFLIGFGYFSLLDYLEGSGWWWLAMPAGMVALLLLT